MRLKRNIISSGGLVNADAQYTLKMRKEAQEGGGKKNLCLNIYHAIKYEFYLIRVG